MIASLYQSGSGFITASRSGLRLRCQIAAGERRPRFDRPTPTPPHANRFRNAEARLTGQLAEPARGLSPAGRGDAEDHRRLHRRIERNTLMRPAPDPLRAAD